MFQVKQVAQLIASAKETINITLRMTRTDAEPGSTRDEWCSGITHDDRRNRCLALKHETMEDEHLAGMEQEQWHNGAVVVAIRDES